VAEAQKVTFFEKKETACPVCETKFTREDLLSGGGRLKDLPVLDVSSPTANPSEFTYFHSMGLAIGVGLTWRLFDGKRSQAAEAQAEAGARQAESLLAAMTKEARFRVREAWLRWKQAQAGIALAVSAEAAAAEGVRLVRVRYENGLAPMVTLLDAQSALNRARSDAARAHADAASALGELLFRAGAGGAVQASTGARS
jgi:outer membrane protein TolC